MFGERVTERMRSFITQSMVVRVLLTALNWADACDITIYRRRGRRRCASDFFQPNRHASVMAATANLVSSVDDKFYLAV